MKPILLLAILSVAVSGCATSPKAFYQNPAKANDTSLCRAVVETKDEKFRRDAADELIRRGLTAQTCIDKINSQNTGIAVVGLLAGAVAIGAAGGYGSGYTAPRSNSTDYDCAGGSGDGPYYVQGPFRLSGPDTYGLDANNNGIACERYGDFGS